MNQISQYRVKAESNHPSSAVVAKTRETIAFLVKFVIFLHGHRRAVTKREVIGMHDRITTSMPALEHESAQEGTCNPAESSINRPPRDVGVGQGWAI
jgi:hypothetical protein